MAGVLRRSSLWRFSFVEVYMGRSLSKAAPSDGVQLSHWSPPHLILNHHDDFGLMAPAL